MINSTSNKQVKRVVSLRSKSKGPAGRGHVCGGRPQNVQELNPEDVDALYVTENFAGDTDNRKWMGRFRPETVSDVVMNVMADTQTPQGVLAVVRQKRYTMDDIVKPAPDGRGSGHHGTGDDTGPRKPWYHNQGRRGALVSPALL